MLKTEGAPVLKMGHVPGQRRLHTNFSTGPLTATVFSSTSSSIPLGYVSGEIEAFIGFLHKCHERQTNSKDENFLFSPAIFDPNRSAGTNRGKANIAYLRHIVLDFENGELRPEELPDLFPGLRMVVTNTFSHTSDNRDSRQFCQPPRLWPPKGGHPDVYARNKRSNNKHNQSDQSFP